MFYSTYGEDAGEIWHFHNIVSLLAYRKFSRKCWKTRIYRNAEGRLTRRESPKVTINSSRQQLEANQPSGYGSPVGMAMDWSPDRSCEVFLCKMLNLGKNCNCNYKHTDHVTDHVPTRYRPHTDHVLTTYRPHTDHIMTTCRPDTSQIPTRYRPRTDHLLTTYRPLTDHIPTTYRLPLPTMYWPRTDRSTCSQLPTNTITDVRTHNRIHWQPWSGWKQPLAV